MVDRSPAGSRRRQPEPGICRRAFRDKSRQLADPPQPITDDYVRTFPVVYGQQQFPGIIGFELQNITFVGEREAALELLRTFGVYQQLDGQLRGLAQRGDRAGALALRLGTRPDQASGTFGGFEAALTEVIRINQVAFDELVGQGFALLAVPRIAAPIIALVVALLAWLGLQPRLREYHV